MGINGCLCFLVRCVHYIRRFYSVQLWVLHNYRENGDRTPEPPHIPIHINNPKSNQPDISSHFDWVPAQNWDVHANLGVDHSPGENVGGSVQTAQ